MRTINNVEIRRWPPDSTKTASGDLGGIQSPVKYSFERFFAASGGAIIVQFRWVPGTNSPTYNSTTKTYTWPANTSTYTTRLHTTPSGAVVDNTTLQMTNVNVTRAELPVASGTLYRLWMHVDFSSISTETDEGAIT